MPEQVRAVMAAGDRHCWTLAQVQEGLEAVGSGADLSTASRAVGRLEASGVVRRVDLDERRTRDEVASEHHEHLICDGCGAVEPMPCAVVVSWVQRVRRERGCGVSDHEVVLRGRCRRSPAVGRRS